MTTALTLYLANAAETATGLTNAKTLYTTAGTASSTEADTQIDALTGFLELVAKGTTVGATTYNAIQAPTGNGFFLDASILSLSGSSFVAGTWSAVQRSGLTAATGTVTCDLYCRVYKYSAGTYTQIVSMVATGQSYTAAANTNITLPSTSASASPSFASGDLLYIDYWVNITATTSTSGQKMRLGKLSLDTSGKTGVSSGSSITSPGYITSTTSTKDASFRLVARAQAQPNASMRFRLQLAGVYLFASARVLIRGLQPRNALLRFILQSGTARDLASRFVLRARKNLNAQTRFLLQIASFLRQKDGSARAVIGASPLKFVPLRFLLQAASTALIRTVAQTVLANLWTHSWNTLASTKQRDGTYPITGGMFINWEQLINWSAYDKYYDVNQAAISASSTQLNVGQTQQNLHDPQVCLQYLRCIALYKLVYGDTSYDANNTSGYMGVSAMVDHVYADFHPAFTSSAQQGYSNPKGWIYFALLDIYLSLKNSPLLTSTQVTNLQQSCLYAAWTYYNQYYNSGAQMLCDPVKGTYQTSQALLMACALIDASQRFPSLITSGMFYTTATDTNSPTNWYNVGLLSANTMLARGCWNSTYNLYYTDMVYNANSTTDTVSSTQGKLGDEGEVAQALIRLYTLTGNTTPSYITQAYTHLQSIEAKYWDVTYGGYYFSYDLSGAGVNAAYKECRASAHMLYAYFLYDRIYPGTFTGREMAITSVLCANMYKSPGSGGYFYRVNSDASFSVYHDNYKVSYSSTLAAPIAVGDTSAQVTGIANLATVGYINLMVNGHGANEEEWTFKLPPVGTSSPYTLQLNPATNGGTGQFTKAHSAGETITSLSFPTSNIESQYTTEAMTGTTVYLLLTQQGANTPAKDGTLRFVLGAFARWDTGMRLLLFLQGVKDSAMRLVLRASNSVLFSSSLRLLLQAGAVLSREDTGLRFSLFASSLAAAPAPIVPAPGLGSLYGEGLGNVPVLPTHGMTVNGVTVTDFPASATVPSSIGGSVLAGSTFTFTYTNPTLATQTLFTSGTQGQLRCVLADGTLATVPVSFVSVLSGTTLQVTCTVTGTTPLMRSVMPSQFF